MSNSLDRLLNREEEEEEQTQQTPYSRPSTPVSPAPPPPSAGVGGAAPPSQGSSLDRLLGTTTTQQEEPKEAPKEKGNLTSYLGETFSDIGIELPESMQKLLGKDPQVPYIKVEKEYLSESMPEFVSSASGKGYAGQQAIDLAAIRSDLIVAKEIKYMQDFEKTNGRAPDQQEYEAARARIHNESNREIYALAKQRRGQRPSALVGSSGAPDRIAWYDIDPEGKLHGGIGPVKFGGEDRSWLERMVSPLALMAVGANHTIVADEIDEEGNATGGYVMPVYNENHALGWLDWVGRVSLFTPISVAAAAGDADSPFDLLKPFGFLPGEYEEMIVPDSWINPLAKGYGSDEMLRRQKRGEDYMSLSSDLALGQLLVPMRTAIWGQEKLGLISTDTADSMRTATDVIAAFGLALLDPDALSVGTAGLGKIAKAKEVTKVMGAFGDLLGVSAATKAAKQKETFNAAAETLVEAISKPAATNKDMNDAVSEALSGFDRNTRIVIVNTAKARMATDPKLSKISEDVFKNFERQAGKDLDYKALATKSTKEMSDVTQGTQKPAKLMGKVARGETDTLKAATKRIDKLKSQGRVAEAKTLSSKVKGYRTMQLFNMSQATILADLLAQKRAMGLLKSVGRASKVASNKSIPQLQKELGDVTKQLQLARKSMVDAYKQTGDAAKSGGTKAFNAAQDNYRSAFEQWHKLALELSTQTSDDAEKILDKLIVEATKKLKQSDARLAKRTKEIDGLRYGFKVDPSEHKKMVKAIVKTAPKQMEHKITASVLAATLREMASEAGKVAEFAKEARPGGITGSMRKTLDEYAKLPRAMVRGADASAVEEAASKAERVGRYYSDYIGVSGVNSKKELAEELINLDPNGSRYPTILQVINFMAKRAESPEDREIAKRLAETIVVSPESRVYIVDKALKDAVDAGKSPFTHNGGLIPEKLLPLGLGGSRALGMVAFRDKDTNFRRLSEGILSAKVKIKNLSEAKKPASLTRTAAQRDDELSEAVLEAVATWSGLRKQAKEYIEVFEARVKRGEDLTDGEKGVYKVFSELEDRLDIVEAQYDKILNERMMAYGPNVSDGSVIKKYPLTTVVNMAGSALKKAEINLEKYRDDFIAEGLAEYKLGPQDMFLAAFDGYAGVNAETIMHELLHVATIEQIRVTEGMTEAMLNSTKSGKAVKNLGRVAKAAASQTDKYVKKLQSKGGNIFIKAFGSLDAEYSKLAKAGRDYADIYLKAGSGKEILNGEAAGSILVELTDITNILDGLRRRNADGVKFLARKEVQRVISAAENIPKLLKEAEAGMDSATGESLKTLSKFLDLIEGILPSLDKTASDIVRLQSGIKILEDAKTVEFKAGLINPARAGRSKDAEYMDIYELITYGLTNQAYIDFLKTVKMPKGNKSLWSNFVRTLANLFGIKNNNALSNLLEATDDLLAMSLDDVFEEAGTAAKTKYFESNIRQGRLETVSQKADLPLNPSEFSREQEIYLLRQIDLMSDYNSKETVGLTGRMLNFMIQSARNIQNPAAAKLGTTSEDLQNIGISTFTDIKGMQADLVRSVGPTARKAGKAAVKAARKAGKLANLTGRDLAKKKMEIRNNAEAEVFLQYITSPETVGGSKYNTIFSGKSLWTQAKPMLRANLGKGAAGRTKAFSTIAKMWFPNLPKNEQDLAVFYKHVEKLLTYGHIRGKKGIEKKVGRELTEAEARSFGNALTFEDFAEQLEKLTASSFMRAGFGTSDTNRKKAMAYAAQAITQMAALNHASTRISKLVGGVSEDTALAASRIVSGLSNNPGEDLEKAIDFLNTLKVPAYVRRARSEADKLLKVGIDLYKDPNSEFIAVLPSSWIEQTSQKLSRVDKIVAEALFKTEDPALRAGLEMVQGAYRIWQTAILTGLFVPRAAYWTAIYIGNVSQVFSEGRPVEAASLALSPVRDAIWASQRLANQTPLGKYVDAAIDYTSNKFGTDFPLASLTNALINKNVNQLMDPRLAPNDAKVAGTDYTFGELRRLAFEERIFQSFASSTKLANLVKRADTGSKNKKLLDALEAPMTFWKDFADTIDQRQRVGLFTDLIINRGLSPQEAGRITREALYDWDSPLTGFEARVLQKIFMFWNFQRRAMGQAMRILMDPYIKGKDDSLTDIMLKSSPVLAAVTGKEAYKTSYLMAMEEMLKQTKYLMIEKGEVQPDGSVEGGTDPAYPSWGTQATNKIFLPNVPMSPDRGANYTNSIGKKPGTPDITHKVMTMPSFTPIEMVNNWADILGVMTAYGVSWAETPANIIRGKGMSEGVGRTDVLRTLEKYGKQMGGPISEKIAEDLFGTLMGEERESYQRRGVPVRRLSDKKILQALDAAGLGRIIGLDSGLIYRDLEMEGDAYRTTPGVLAFYRMIPGLSNEISTLFEPFLNNSAEGAEVTEALNEWFFNLLGFKTYRYSPEYVKQQDVKDIKKKISLQRRELERQTGIKVK